MLAIVKSARVAARVFGDERAGVPHVIHALSPKTLPRNLSHGVHLKPRPIAASG
jgi:hypothetical protein